MKSHWIWICGLAISGILPAWSEDTYYPTNRPPLVAARFIELPLGSVKAEGWLLDQLRIQAEGLTGHLDEFWESVSRSAWKGGGGDAWERGPYYLDGLVPLAYILNDERLIQKGQSWLEWILSQCP